MLSRNKTINYLHILTGWSYKKCRTKLKANNWSLYGILYPRECLFKDSFNSLNKAVVNFGIQLKDALNSIDYVYFIATTKQAIRDIYKAWEANKNG